MENKIGIWTLKKKSLFVKSEFAAIMFKTMTFNIRYGTATNGDSRWHKRKDLVIERICVFSPDLLDLQECRDDG